MHSVPVPVPVAGWKPETGGLTGRRDTRILYGYKVPVADEDRTHCCMCLLFFQKILERKNRRIDHSRRAVT